MIDDLYLSTNQTKQKVYILFICKYTEDEAYWETIGVYSSHEKASKVRKELMKDGNKYDSAIEEYRVQ